MLFYYRAPHCVDARLFYPALHGTRCFRQRYKNQASPPNEGLPGFADGVLNLLCASTNGMLIFDFELTYDIRAHLVIVQ